MELAERKMRLAEQVLILLALPVQKVQLLTQKLGADPEEKEARRALLPAQRMAGAQGT